MSVWSPQMIQKHESLWMIAHKILFYNKFNSSQLSKIFSLSSINLYSKPEIQELEECDDLYDLGMNTEQIKQSLDSPISSEGLINLNLQSLSRLSPFLRFCKKCMKMGYHSPIHQVPVLNKCPIHREPLEYFCPNCERKIPYTISRHYLKHPFRCFNCNYLLINNDTFTVQQAINRSIKNNIKRINSSLCYHSEVINQFIIKSIIPHWTEFDSLNVCLKLIDDEEVKDLITPPKSHEKVLKLTVERKYEDRIGMDLYPIDSNLTEDLVPGLRRIAFPYVRRLTNHYAQKLHKTYTSLNNKDFKICMLINDSLLSWSRSWLKGECVYLFSTYCRQLEETITKPRNMITNETVDGQRKLLNFLTLKLLKFYLRASLYLHVSKSFEGNRIYFTESNYDGCFKVNILINKTYIDFFVSDKLSYSHKVIEKIIKNSNLASHYGESFENEIFRVRL